jgi:hypothetical protein
LVALGFGISIGNVLDPRPLGHVIISIALVIFSGLTLFRSSTGQVRIGEAAGAINPRA